MIVIDGCAGPGGWDVAASALEPLGLEWDDAACATRAAAGLLTLQGDVSQLDPRKVMSDHFRAGARLDGLIFSPPCQAFSMAGKGAGRKALEAYHRAIRQMARGEQLDVAALDAECGDPRAHLVLEPLRWALALTPDWIVLEQVAPVLPLWDEMATALRAHGWHAWTGVLSAEQYGVPQTRKRAILIGSRSRRVGMPSPSHQRYIAPRKVEEATLGLFEDPLAPERVVHPEDRQLLPWVSMAQALGWGMTGRPYPVVAGGTGGGPDLEKVGGSAARSKIYGEQAAGRWAGEFLPTGQLTKNGNHADGEWLPDSRLTVNTGRDWKQGGAREDAQQFDSEERPAPAVDGKGRWHVVDRGCTRSGAQPNGGRARDVDEPAPPLTTRADQMEWTAERPATTVCGRPDIFPPGHKINADDIAAGRGGQRRSGAGWTDGRPATTVTGSRRSEEGGTMRAPSSERPERGGQDAAVRVSLAEALVLQSFPPDYPVQGTKTKQFEQVGNAVPPFLALAVLREALG